MKNSILTSALFVLMMVQSRAQLFWINEFHYDNAGGDVGEFVEIAAPSTFTDLSTVTLTLYNGSGGTSYGTHKLSTFTAGANSGDYTFYSKSFSSVLQNGAPDGFALDQSGTVLQFLSYEGTFTATSGAANGQTSTDIGVAESDPGTASGASLGLTGLGFTYADFSWTTFASDSHGALNLGQSFSAVPEPHEYALVAALALLGFAGYRRRIKRPKASDANSDHAPSCLV